MSANTKLVWTPDLIARALELSRRGLSRAAVDCMLGLRPGATASKLFWLRHAERREEYERRRREDKDARPASGAGRERATPTPAAIAAAQARHDAARTLTGLLMGDPPPGFSALDRRNSTGRKS